MKLLIIGGTIFVGRHLVEAAQAAGHTVTLLNRGKTNPNAFPGVQTIHGDRENDAAWKGLAARTFDAVLDTCGYVPRVVQKAADALKNAAECYCFVSSISVFRDFEAINMDETAPLAVLPNDQTTETVTGETYGPLKVACEYAAESVFGAARTLIVRPGYIVGPHDPTDRFTYWVNRVSHGGRVLCPGSPDAPLQIIDARDLARWIINQLETGASGPYNATGPDFGLTWGEMLETCRTASGSEAEFIWLNDETIARHEVGGGQLPLYAPNAPDYQGLIRINCGKSIKSGLTFRPLRETVADTLVWNQTRDGAAFVKQLSREKEAEILTSVVRA